jgi:hypothetical protein
MGRRSGPRGSASSYAGDARELAPLWGDDKKINVRLKSGRSGSHCNV